MVSVNSRTVAAVIGVILLAAACGSETTVDPPPPPPPGVTIVPATVPDLTVGQTITLIAVVSNTTNQAVTWSVQPAAGVASVSAGGVVTALSPGVATVIATSAANPNASAAVSLRVVDAAPAPGQSTILIAAVNRAGTGQPVNPGAVEGGVDVLLNVEVPSGVAAAAVRTLIGSTEVCHQTFTGSGSTNLHASAAAIITCSFNTAQLDAAGVPRFPNAQYQITAQIVDAVGTALASATSQPYAFVNADQLTITVAAAGAEAADGAGLTWSEGDLAVNVRAAIFSGASSNLASVAVVLRDTLAGPAIASRTISTSTNGVFTYVFPEANTPNAATPGVAGVEAPLIVTATSVTAGGQPGPSGTAGRAFMANPLTSAAPAVRLDNRAPTITAQPVVASGTWFGSAATLADYRGAAAAADGGVGQNTFTVQYRAVTSTDTADWSGLATAAALPETEVNEGPGSWSLRVRVCDALQNCADSDATGPVGVDRTPPAVSLNTGSVKDRVINVAGTWIVDMSDDRSSFGPEPLRTRIVRRFPGLSAADACVLGTFVNNVCQPASTTASVPLPTTDQGYYTFTARAVDRAGNISLDSVTLQALVDNVDPVVGPIGMPLSMSGGTSVTFNPTASDDLDLARLIVGVRYGAIGPLLAAESTVGAAFDATLTTSASANVTVSSFIRSVASAPNSIGQVATGVTAIAVDVAGNTAENSANIQAGVVAGPTDNEFTQVSAFTLTASVTEVCATPGGTGCSPAAGRTSSATLTARATGASGTFANPAQRVNFYGKNASGHWVLIGSVTAATSTDDGVTRTFRWTRSTSASAMQLGSNDFLAVAINVDGSGLATNEVSITRTN